MMEIAVFGSVTQSWLVEEHQRYTVYLRSWSGQLDLP